MAALWGWGKRTTDGDLQEENNNAPGLTKQCASGQDRQHWGVLLSSLWDEREGGRKTENEDERLIAAY